ncbi:MAG: methyltransferase domain-containing protein [Deltaproteobacteria bacterium]|nr:methyltransferase domain-containing protein [Deltaproteobacteria bacterium]
MGHVFDFNEALAYEQWISKPQNKFAFELQTELMRNLLQPMRGESVLDIGCGTGECLVAFLEMGLRVTGLDPSAYMLDLALKKIGHRADLYREFAEDLPFDDNSFNYTCLFTTLEFVENPQKALQEAFRVTKDRVFIGVLNRYAIKGIQRRVKGIFTPTIFNHARFYSVWELKQMIRSIMGHVPVSWRTVCQLPTNSGKFVYNLEQSKIIQRCPFGAFAGIVVTLVPRLRTRPLTVRYQAKGSSGA